MQIQSNLPDSQLIFSNNENLNNFIVDCKTFIERARPLHKKLKLEEKQKVSKISKDAIAKKEQIKNERISPNSSQINKSSKINSKENKELINFDLFCLPRTNDRFRFANKNLEIQENFKKNGSGYRSEGMDAIQKNLKDIENQNLDYDILKTNLKINMK